MARRRRQRIWTAAGFHPMQVATERSKASDNVRYDPGSLTVSRPSTKLLSPSDEETEAKAGEDHSDGHANDLRLLQGCNGTVNLAKLSLALSLLVRPCSVFRFVSKEATGPTTKLRSTRLKGHEI